MRTLRREDRAERFSWLGGVGDEERREMLGNKGREGGQEMLGGVDVPDWDFVERLVVRPIISVVRGG